MEYEFTTKQAAILDDLDRELIQLRKDHDVVKHKSVRAYIKNLIVVKFDRRVRLQNKWKKGGDDLGES